MTVLLQVAEVLKKDLLIEWRARSRAFALACFMVTILLLFSFAVGADAATMRTHAGAYLWLSLLLSSTLLLAQSFQVETESGAIETVMLAPTTPPALYYGKALANLVQLLLLAAVAVPFVLGLFDGAVRESVALLAVTVALGCAGLAAPGTLYAALTARLGARQLLLPLLLFPLVVPCLLASVKATALVMMGDPMEQVPSWLQLLTAFDVLYWAVCGVLFGRVIDA
ncbi:MAG: heme exporter protein CcmB [Myxococcota bacterium]|nr:heme exporter protein CcmB [Myxococcota bacterium]